VIAHRSIADHVGEALQEKVVEKVRPPDREIGVNCGVHEALRLSPRSTSEKPPMRQSRIRDGADSVRSGHFHPGSSQTSA